MNKNNFVIKEFYIKHFEIMIKDIEDCGRTEYCPVWFNSLIDKGDIDDCNICRNYFTRLDKSGTLEDNCPCDHYSKSYLIRFLRKVITNSE